MFSISVLAFAMMNNFLHVLVHAAPDSVARWSDGEVAARWVRLFPVPSAGNFDEESSRLNQPYVGAR